MEGAVMCFHQDVCNLMTGGVFRTPYLLHSDGDLNAAAPLPFVGSPGLDDTFGTELPWGSVLPEPLSGRRSKK